MFKETGVTALHFVRLAVERHGRIVSPQNVETKSRIQAYFIHPGGLVEDALRAVRWR